MSDIIEHARALAALRAELNVELAELRGENKWLRGLLADVIRDPRKAKRLQSAAGEIMDYINTLPRERNRP